MAIANRTSQPIDVAYHVISAGADSIESHLILQVGESKLFLAPFHEGTECARGTLVATAGGTTISTLDKPCQGSRWEITEPASPPPT